MIVLNALAIAAGYPGPAERQAVSALGVVRHETFHALFARYRRTAPTWRRSSSSSPVQELMLLVLNEGVAHFADRRRWLLEHGLPKERGTRALERLARALERQAQVEPGSAEARQIVGAAGEGPYWDKFGAISGMLLTLGVYRAMGVPGIRESLRCGPGRLVQLYRGARQILPHLPEPPEILVRMGKMPVEQTRRGGDAISASGRRHGPDAPKSDVIAEARRRHGLAVRGTHVLREAVPGTAA